MQIKLNSFETLTQFSVFMKINVFLIIMLIFLRFISRLKHKVVKFKITYKRASRIINRNFFLKLMILKSE